MMKISLNKSIGGLVIVSDYVTMPHMNETPKPSTGETTTMNRAAKKRSFIEACRAAGLTNPIERCDLVSVCEQTGLYSVPPTWITNDESRKAGRGFYSMPELESPDVTPAPVHSPPIDVQGAVESSIACALGMTSGERTSLIPGTNDEYVPWGHFSDVQKIIKSGRFYPIFITGMSGNGKTTMVEQVCAKLGRECYRVNITKQTDEDDLLGGFRLINGNTVWQDGPVVSAMLEGGILLLDEIDLASHNIMCLQPVLEGKGVFLKKVGRWITPKDGFTIFATANTKGKGSDDGRFIGTGVMNEAFLDRFPITLEQPYATRGTEQKILAKAGCESEFALHLCKWVEIIRKSFAEGAIDEIISTRRLVDISHAFDIFGNKEKAISFCLARFDDDTKEAFLNLYSKVDADMTAGEDSPADEEAPAVEAETSTNPPPF